MQLKSFLKIKMKLKKRLEFHLYKFDRELRLLVFSAVEKIEVAVRGQLAYNYSIDLNNSFWLDDSSLFTNQKKYSDTYSYITITLCFKKSQGQELHGIIILYFSTYWPA